MRGNCPQAAPSARLSCWLGGLICLGSLIEGFRSDVSPIRPRYRAGIDEEAGEVGGVSYWFEDGSLEPIPEIDCPDKSIIEGYTNPETADVLSMNDRRE